MFDIRSLGAFAEVNALLPDDIEVQIAVQLLVMQAYARGQIDSVAIGAAAATHVSDNGTRSANTDDNT